MSRDLLLLVDDDPSMLTLLQHLISNLGFRTALCSDATDAIAWLKANNEIPSAILTDVVMKDLDGLTLAVYLKESKRYSAIPIVVISAVSDTATIETTVGLGCAGYIPKPIDPTTFGGTLRRILDSARTRRPEVRTNDLFGSTNVWIIPTPPKDRSRSGNP